MWLDDDRTWALALLAEEAETCPGCGQRAAEAADPRNEGAYLPVVHRCHACTAKDAGAEKYSKEKPGLYVGVRHRDRS